MAGVVESSVACVCSPVRVFGASVFGPLGLTQGLTGSPVCGVSTSVGVGVVVLWRWSLRPVSQAWMELLVSGVVLLFRSVVLFLFWFSVVICLLPRTLAWPSLLLGRPLTCFTPVARPP